MTGGLYIFCLLGLLFSVPAFGVFWLTTVAVRRSRTHKLKGAQFANRFGTLLARKILSKPDRYLVTSQMCMYFAALLTGVLITLLFIPSLGDGLGFLNFTLPLGFVTICIWVVGILGVLFFKAIAYSNPERLLCLISYPLAFISDLLNPVLWFINVLLRPLLVRFGLRQPIERELAISADELTEIVEKSSKAGKLEEGESEMLKSVISFSDSIVREVMTPRKDIVAVREDASLEQILAVFVRDGVSRVVVVGEHLDDVKGLLIGKDLIALIGKNLQSFSLRNYLRPVFTVLETKQVDDLLQDFRREAIHFAVVIDEHGGVTGVVTVEDLIEEIVGDIFDEYDKPERPQGVREVKAGEILIEGSRLIDDLNNDLKIGLPYGEYDTIAGFVIQRLGHIPKRGEAVEFNELRISVEGVEDYRITKVRISGLQALERAPQANKAENSESGSVSSSELSSDKLRVA